MDGDRRSRADAESKRAESRQKMMLLQNALKKYQNLNVMGDLNEEDAGAWHSNVSSELTDHSYFSLNSCCC